MLLLEFFAGRGLFLVLEFCVRATEFALWWNRVLPKAKSRLAKVRA